MVRAVLRAEGWSGLAFRFLEAVAVCRWDLVDVLQRVISVRSCAIAVVGSRWIVDMRRCRRCVCWKCEMKYVSAVIDQYRGRASGGTSDRTSNDDIERSRLDVLSNVNKEEGRMGQQNTLATTRG